MLRDQIHNRLSAVADDRQSLLMSGLSQVEERIRIFAGRYRLSEFLERRTGGAGPAPMESENSRVLDDIRGDAEGVVAFWVEDRNQRRIASSGPRDLIDFCAD